MTLITKRKDLPDLRFHRYRPIAKVITAIQLTEPVDIPSSDTDGQMFHGEPGDWKIIHGANSDGSLVVAICAQDIFTRIFEHEEGDQYRKKSSLVIEAAQLKEPLDIITLEGPAHGEPGDWLLLGIEGEPYFNDDTYFKGNYLLAEEEIL